MSHILKLTLAILALGLIGYKTYVKPIENAETIVEEHSAIEADSIKKEKLLTDSIIEFSFELLGTPYVTAGNGKGGFDCSGFVYFVFQHFSISVPRSSKDYKNYGQEILINDAQKGDILVFMSPTRNEIGHVGIVTKADGMNSDFIHATSGGQKAVVITSLTSPYYTKRFVKVVRVID